MEEENPWTIAGGVRIAGARRKTASGSDASVRASLRVSMESSSFASTAVDASDDAINIIAAVSASSPLRTLVPGNVSLHRAAEAELAARKARNIAGAGASGRGRGRQRAAFEGRAKKAPSAEEAIVTNKSPPRRTRDADAADAPPPSPPPPPSPGLFRVASLPPPPSPTSEARARVARRRHRKRLAQIVVGQARPNSHWSPYDPVRDVNAGP